MKNIKIDRDAYITWNLDKVFIKSIGKNNAEVYFRNNEGEFPIAIIHSDNTLPKGDNAAKVPIHTVPVTATSGWSVSGELQEKFKSNGMTIKDVARHKDVVKLEERIRELENEIWMMKTSVECDEVIGNAVSDMFSIKKGDK